SVAARAPSPGSPRAAQRRATGAKGARTSVPGVTMRGRARSCGSRLRVEDHAARLAALERIRAPHLGLLLERQRIEARAAGAFLGHGRECAPVAAAAHALVERERVPVDAGNARRALLPQLVERGLRLVRLLLQLGALRLDLGAHLLDLLLQVGEPQLGARRLLPDVAGLRDVRVHGAADQVDLRARGRLLAHAARALDPLLVRVLPFTLVLRARLELVDL